MINHFSKLSLLIVGLSTFSIAFADETLKHDPFARPLLTTATVATAESGAKVEEETPWNPTLTAVMVAGGNSLITIDGLIMKLGELKDGYRLVQVKDREAVFKKGKKRVVLEIKAGAIRSGTGSESALEALSGNEKSLLRQNKEQGNTQ